MADISLTINAYLVFPAGKAEQWRTLASELEGGGLPVRRQKWQNPRYRFTLQAAFTTKSTADAFLAFFSTHKGGRTSFDWTPPTQFDTGGPYTCLFAADELAQRFEGPERWVFTFDLLAVT